MKVVDLVGRQCGQVGARVRYLALAGAVLWMSWGCATTRAVRTLGKRGANELSLGAGAPLSSDYRNANPPPIPVLHAGARHGVNERLDVFGDAQLGASMFGLMWLDAGAAYAVWPRDPGP